MIYFREITILMIENSHKSLSDPFSSDTKNYPKVGHMNFVKIKVSHMVYFREITVCGDIHTLSNYDLSL